MYESMEVDPQTLTTHIQYLCSVKLQTMYTARICQEH